ncbi:MAG: serine hydrolase [Actinobacteria bacterium]|nr:serine hydrolase [Actinomycetota bacterium]
MVTVHGKVKPGFEGVSEAFANNFADGFEVGASVAVVYKGEMVVDIWAGHREMERTSDWQSDTLVNVWSTTKTMMFLTLLTLADRGEISLTDPVYKYWPEFKVNSKEGIEIRHLMAHTAGLSGWAEPMVPEDMYNHDKCAAVLGAQAPWWTPGSQSGYHAITQGYLIGEVVKRVTGQSLGNFFRENFAEPLGADFHIGTAAEHHHRITNVIPGVSLLDPTAQPDSIAVRTYSNPKLDARIAWTPEWRQCESPAANGHGNARSVAQVQSIISHGGEAGGKRFLSAAGVEALFTEQMSGQDLILGVPMKFGMGYGLNSEFTPLSPNARACFWGGWGGSLVVNDLDAGLTYAYVMNRMGQGTTGDMRAALPLMATFGAIA